MSEVSVGMVEKTLVESINNVVNNFEGSINNVVNNFEGSIQKLEDKISGIEKKKRISLNQNDFKYGPYICEQNNVKLILEEDIKYGLGWVTEDKRNFWKFIRYIEGVTKFPAPALDSDDTINTILPETYLRMPKPGWTSIIYLIGNNIELDLNGHTISLATEKEGCPLWACSVICGVLCSNSIFSNLIFPSGMFGPQQTEPYVSDATITGNTLLNPNDISENVPVIASTNVLIHNGSIYATHMGINCSNVNGLEIKNVLVNGWVSCILGNQAKDVLVKNVTCSGISKIHYVNVVQARYYILLQNLLFFYRLTNALNYNEIKSFLYEYSLPKNVVFVQLVDYVDNLLDIVYDNDFFEPISRPFSWLQNIRNNNFSAVKFGQLSPSNLTTTFPLNSSSEVIEDWLYNENEEYLCKNIKIENLTIENCLLSYNDILNNRPVLLNYPDLNRFTGGTGGPAPIAGTSTNTNVVFDSVLDYTDLYILNRDANILLGTQVAAFLAFWFDTTTTDFFNTARKGCLLEGKLLSFNEKLVSLYNSKYTNYPINNNNLSEIGMTELILTTLMSSEAGGSSKLIIDALVFAQEYYSVLQESSPLDGNLAILSGGFSSNADNSLTTMPKSLIDLRKTINASCTNIKINNITIINLDDFKSFKRADWLIEKDRSIFDTDENPDITATQAIENFNRFVSSIKTSTEEEDTAKGDYYYLLKSNSGGAFSWINRSFNFSNDPQRTYGINWSEFMDIIQKNYTFKGNNVSQGAVNLMSLNLSITENGLAPLSYADNFRLYHILLLINFLVVANIDINNVSISNVNDFVNYHMIMTVGINTLIKGASTNGPIKMGNVLPNLISDKVSNWKQSNSPDTIVIDLNTSNNAFENVKSVFFEYEKYYNPAGERINN